MKVADWPGTSVVVAPEQVPAGALNDWQAGVVVSADAGADWASAIPTEVSVTLPVFFATNV